MNVTTSSNKAIKGNITNNVIMYNTHGSALHIEGKMPNPKSSGFCNFNFQSLEVVARHRDPQLQVIKFNLLHLSQNVYDYRIFETEVIFRSW